MSTPTEQFAHLSIESYQSQASMASPDEVRARAVQVQDILSSFYDVLPSEFEPQIMRNIDDNMNKSYHNRPKDYDWTISGNLNGTLLQWAAYNDAWYERLVILKSANSLANAFLEKLNRRFKDALDLYDEIVEQPPSAADLGSKIESIANEYTSLSKTFARDWERRKHIEEISLTVQVRMLQMALDVLQEVCQRTQVIIPSGSEPSRRTTRRTASATATHPSLFMILITQRAEEDEEPFLLTSLEQFPGSALRRCLSSLKIIAGLLHRNDAPRSFISRFDILQALATDEDDESSALQSQAESSGRRSGLEMDPRPGSKRPQASTGATPKRGKKTGGK